MYYYCRFFQKMILFPCTRAHIICTSMKGYRAVWCVWSANALIFILLYPSVIQCTLLSLRVCILHLTDMLYSAGENIWHLDCDGGVVRAGSHDSSKSSPVPENDMSATTTKRKYIWDMLCMVQSLLCVTLCYLQHGLCALSWERILGMLLWTDFECKYTIIVAELVTANSYRNLLLRCNLDVMITESHKVVLSMR